MAANFESRRSFPVRPATVEDLPAVSEIQRLCPEASQWSVADYLAHDFLVAIAGKTIAGFLVFRQVAPGEREVLNLAVSLDFRRRGVGRALLNAAISDFEGTVFLEVRESNLAAQEFYNSLTFKSVARRVNYYSSPPESAIVMKFHSC